MLHTRVQCRQLLGQTIGAALVALVFGYAGPSGGASPTVAILLASGFSALAAVISVSRLLNFVRVARSSRAPDSVGPTAPGDRAIVRPPP